MELSLKDFMVGGLKADERMAINSRNMVTLTGLMATPQGAVGIKKPDLDIGNGWPVNYVFNTPARVVSVGLSGVTTYSYANSTAKLVSDNLNLSTQHLNNSSFASATNWILNTGWAISSGAAVKSVSASDTALAQTTLASAFPTSSPPTPLLVRITVSSITVGGWVYATCNGNFTEQVQLRLGVNYLFVICASGSGGFSLTASADSAFSIADLTVNTLDVALGTESQVGFSHASWDKWWVQTAHSAYMHTYLPTQLAGAVVGGAIEEDAVIVRWADIYEIRMAGVCGGRPIALFQSTSASKASIAGSDYGAITRLSASPLDQMCLLIGADCRFTDPPFVHELALMSGGAFLTSPYLPMAEELLANNQMAVIPLGSYTASGALNFAVKLSENSVVVAGMDGIRVVRWAADRNGVHDIEVQKLAAVSAYTVGGSAPGVFWRDAVYILMVDYTLAKVTQDGQYVNLGYQEHLSDLGATYSPCLTVNLREDFIMIASYTQAFVFNGALSKCLHAYPSLAALNHTGQYYQAATVNNLTGDGTLALLTNDIDVDALGDFVLHSVHPQYRGISNLRCRVHYKVGYADADWRVTPWQYQFDRGFIIPIVMAKLVRLEFAGTVDDADSSGIYDVVVKFQQRGRRNARREVY